MPDHRSRGGRRAPVRAALPVSISLPAAPEDPPYTRDLRPILIFDGDCGFCTSVAEAARRRLPSSVEVVPWQWLSDLARHGLTAEDAARHAYWIDGEGRPHRGHRAVAAALEAMGGPWRLAGAAIRLPVLETVAAGAYDLIAEHRHRLPGGTPACRLPGP